MVRYRFDECVLDTSRRELTCSDRVCRISARAFEALRALLERYPDALAREDLYGRLWPDTFVNLTNLNNVIAEIRSATGDRTKRIVLTKHRFGYAIGVPVTRGSAFPAAGARCSLYIAGATALLREGDNLVGRAPDAAVVVDLPSISRRHAVIRVDGQRAEIVDLHSKNGTFVEDKRVADVCELSDNATIRFGSVSGVFRVLPFDGTTATDPASGRGFYSYVFC